ncbi:MAG: hypothetical protein FJ109_10260 [Deltaproteobacteria bacterium]|nr:hypothetical protein [Deltaproteobacteria bacterium]
MTDEIEMLVQTSHSRQERFRKAACRAGDEDWLSTADRHLSVPKNYFCFGRFDLLWLCMVDDVEVAVGAYRPFGPVPGKKGGRDEAETFAHQVMVCPVPRFAMPSPGGFAGRTPLMGVQPWLDAQTTRAGQELPLVGLCQLKANSVLAAPAGVAFLRGLVRALKYIGEYDLATGARKEATSRPLRVFVLESYSWHELVVLLWADSFQTIADTINDISALTTERLCEFLLEVARQLEKDAPDEAEGNLNLVRQIVGWARRESKRLDEAGVSSPAPGELKTSVATKELLRRHVFLNTTSHVGVDLATAERARSDHSALNSISDRDSVAWGTRWYIESGHEHSVDEKLGSPSASGAACSVLGAGDLWYPLAAKGHSRDLVRQVYADHRKALSGVFGANAALTIVGQPSPHFSPSPHKVYDYHDSFRRRGLLVRQRRVEKLHRLLYTAGFCRVASRRVLNMVSVYNDAISDNLLFSSVSELHPFVDWAVHMLEKLLPSCSTDAVLASRLNRAVMCWVDEFEHAFRNRHRSSHRLGDTSEVNIDFQGGVQQLVTALHGALNALGYALRVPPGLVWVGGDSLMSASSFCTSMHVNPFHAFQPEHFAAMYAHEVGHAWVSPCGDLGQLGFSEEASRVTDRRQAPKFGALWERLERTYCLGRGRRITSQEHGIVLLEEIVADSVAVVFSFGKDLRLFLWWYFHHLLQEGAYSHIRTEEDVLVLIGRFFFRWLSAARLVLPKLTKREVSDFFAEMVRGAGGQFPCRQVKLLQAVETAFELAEELVQSTEAGGLLRELAARCSRRYARCLAAAFPDGGADAWGRFCNETHAAIAQGTVVELADVPQTYSHDRSFATVHAVLLSYLRLLARDSDHFRLALLPRSSDGNPKADELCGLGPILFDRRGGTFVADPKARRDYAMWRATVVMSLWDVATKNKAAYWTDLAKRHRPRPCPAGVARGGPSGA